MRPSPNPTLSLRIEMAPTRRAARSLSSYFLENAGSVAGARAALERFFTDHAVQGEWNVTMRRLVMEELLALVTESAIRLRRNPPM